MPDDVTDSSRLQPSINLHAPVTFFLISCSGIPIVLPQRDEGSGKPYAVIEAVAY